MNIEEMKGSMFTAPVEQYIAAVKLRNFGGHDCSHKFILRAKDYILGVLILLEREREFTGTIRELYKAFSSIGGLTLPVKNSLGLSAMAISVLDSYGAIDCEEVKLKNQTQGYIYKLSLYEKINAADLFESVEIFEPEYKTHQRSYTREDPVIKHLFEGPYHLRITDLRSWNPTRVTSLTLRQYLEECRRNGEMICPVLTKVKKMTKREELEFTRRTLIMVHNLASELETNQVGPEESYRRMKELVTYRIGKLVATKEAIREYRSRNKRTDPDSISVGRDGADVYPSVGQRLREDPHFIAATLKARDRLQAQLESKKRKALSDCEEEQ